MRSGLRRAFRNQGGPPVPLAASNAGFLQMMDLSMGLRGQSADYLNAYAVMSTVYSCVQLLAESAARVTWRLYRSQPVDARRRYGVNDPGVDQRTEILPGKHQALKVLSKPNDFFTQTRLFELDETYLGLTGEYYWVIERAGGVSFPTGIWPVRPDRMEPVPHPQKYISGWVYTSPDGRQQIPLSVDEVIQVALPNPLDPMHGMGPVQSILVDVDAASYSAQWNRNFFINSATPYGIITTPNSLDDVEFKQLMDRWRETHRGISRTGRVGVLEAGSTFTPVGMSMKDMDFSALRNLSRDIVREAFRMHKVMLGVSDDVNRANAQTGEEVFAAWGVVPRLDRKRDMLNNVFLPMFGATGTGVEFDYITPVPSNREQEAEELRYKAEAVQRFVDSGFDPHDVLEMVGLPDMGVLEQATQAPALPPAWVPEQSAPAAPSPAEAAARLRKVLSNGHQHVEMPDLAVMR